MTLVSTWDDGARLAVRAHGSSVILSLNATPNLFHDLALGFWFCGVSWQP